MTVDVAFEGLCAAVRPIAERHGVERMTLFGSVARGDDTDASDYDFCVSLGRVDDLVKLCSFIIDLESALGRPVDVVSERSLSDDLAKEVSAHGRLVYGT